MPEVAEELSSSSSDDWCSPAFSSSSSIWALASASSDLVDARSIFRLCISLSFCPMMRLSRPIYSVFSESDFSSLRRRWFIMRRTSSVSVHCLAISQTKIDIFYETAKWGFTSLNGESVFAKNVKSALMGDCMFDGDNLTA